MGNKSCRPLEIFINACHAMSREVSYCDDRQCMVRLCPGDWMVKSGAQAHAVQTLRAEPYVGITSYASHACGQRVTALSGNMVLCLEKTLCQKSKWQPNRQ